MTGRFRHLSLRRTFLFCVIVGIFFIPFSVNATRFSAVTDSYVYLIPDGIPRANAALFKANISYEKPVELYGYNIHTKEKFCYTIKSTLPIRGLVANDKVVCVWTEKFLVLSRHEKPLWENQYTFSGTDTTIKDVALEGSKAYFVADVLYALSPDKVLSQSYFSISEEIPQIILYQGKGYTVGSNGNQVYEVSLEILAIERICTFGNTITQVHVSKGKGYVVTCFPGTNLFALHIIDLGSFTETACVSLSYNIEKVSIQEPFAYVVDSNTIELIDLTTKTLLASREATSISVTKLYPCGVTAYILTQGQNFLFLDFINDKVDVLLKGVYEFHLLGDYGYALMQQSPTIHVVLLKAGQVCGTIDRKPGQQIAVTKKGLFSPEGYLTNLWIPPFIPEHALPLMYDNPGLITFDWEAAAQAEVKCDALINWIYAEEDPQYFYLFAQTVHVDGKVATAHLIKALEVNEPDARSFMYLAFRDGKWGAPKIETLALFYDDKEGE